MGEGGKEKIAILGGGMSSLATAFALTSEPGWQEKYDITVYQVGHRLGGKGASGRGENGRIEEHGLHIWIGFYENAFRLIRLAYKEMVDRGLCPPDAPLATFEQAFKKHSLIMVEEPTERGIKPWVFPCPTNDSVPGDPLPGAPGGVDPEFPSPEDYFSMLLQIIHSLFQAVPQPSASAARDAAKEVVQRRGCLTGWLGGKAAKIEEGVEALGLEAGWQMLQAATALAAKIGVTPDGHRHEQHPEMVEHFERFLAWLRGLMEKELAGNDEVRHLFVMIDLCVAAARGVVADGLVTKGLEAADDEDLRAWLLRHGAAKDSAYSAAIRFLYDLAFAYEDGDGDKPSMAAGTALRCIVRVFFTYKGAIFWKMQAGMGDTVFTPVYHCLRARGVKFEFFHRVREVVPTDDGRSIARVRVGRQVALKDPAAEYYPLLPVGGIDCWPSEPLYDQIADEDAAALQADGIDLESFWTPWKEREERVLEAGRDFDRVVLGISLAALEFLCPRIVEQKPAWRAMLDNVKTTRTMGLQLWLKRDLPGLGWTLGSPVLDGYTNPLNTWADMSQLLPREQWPAEDSPKSLAYFCGTVTGHVPPETESGYPREAFQWAFKTSRDWLEQSTGGLWPDATKGDGSPALDWDLLVGEGGGERRLASQFVRINIDPSERYVLSVAGSTKYRIKADQSGYDNLVLTGDWIDNGFNAGCIEAAVMSGMLASNAVAGYPAKSEIIGLGRP